MRLHNLIFIVASLILGNFAYGYLTQNWEITEDRLFVSVVTAIHCYCWSYSPYPKEDVPKAV